MVIIVQLEERKIVDLDVRGSRPFNHPRSRNSMVEWLPCKQQVVGSSPSGSFYEIYERKGVDYVATIAIIITFTT